MGPDALDWHNWFGPSKNLLSLLNFQFVKHGSTETRQNMCWEQVSITWTDKQHRLRAVRGKGYMWSQELWADGDL